MDTPNSLNEWSDPPAMEPGSPEPALRQIGTDLWVAYRCRNPEFPGWESGAAPDHPGFDEYYALLRFEGVDGWVLGGPSEQELPKHELWQLGIRWYGFYRGFIRGEATSVITFHDETLQVRCTSTDVVHRRLLGNTTAEALESFFAAAGG